MKQTITLSLLLLGIFFLAGCEKKQTAPNQPVSPNPSQAQPTIPKNQKSTPTDEAANWQTYRNEKYGFEINYPAGWPVLDINPGECDENNVCNIIFGIDKPLSITGEGNGVGAVNHLIYLYIYSPTALKANDGNDGNMGCKNNRKETLPSGLQVEKKQCPDPVGGPLMDVYSLDKNGWKYQLVEDKNAGVKYIDEMAASFQFIN